MTLTEFLLARIAEDETAASAATDGPWFQGVSADGGQQVHSEALVIAGEEFTDVTTPAVAALDAAHIARHHPARVLAECEAKRSIVAECEATINNGVSPSAVVMAELVLAHLAKVYSDHPDYPKVWKP